jgi:hypothetical protein
MFVTVPCVKILFSTKSVRATMRPVSWKCEVYINVISICSNFFQFLIRDYDMKSLPYWLKSHLYNFIWICCARILRFNCRLNVSLSSGCIAVLLLTRLCPILGRFTWCVYWQEYRRFLRMQVGRNQLFVIITVICISRECTLSFATRSDEKKANNFHQN